MDKEILFEILNSKSEKYSSATIEGILNEELDKTPDEMDTELIDLCLDALENISAGQQKKRRIRINFTKLVTAAAIFVLAIGVSIPACAKFFDIDMPDGVITAYKDYLDVDLKGDEYIRYIDVKLEQDGFSGEFLPSIFYTGEAKVFDYETQHSSFDSYGSFDFSYNNVYGDVRITRYYDEETSFAGQLNFMLEPIKTEYFEMGDFNGVIFTTDELVSIYYSDGLTEYDVAIYGDMKEAAEIAEEFLN